MVELEDVLKAVAGDEADQVLNHIKEQGKGAVLVSFIAPTDAPEQEAPGLTDEYYSLADLSAKQRKELMTHLVIGEVLSKQKLGNDILVSKRCVRELDV